MISPIVTLGAAQGPGFRAVPPLRARDIVVQIPPSRIRRFDAFDLCAAAPELHRFLSLDGGFRVTELLKMDKGVHP